MTHKWEEWRSLNRFKIEWIVYNIIVLYTQIVQMPSEFDSFFTVELEKYRAFATCERLYFMITTFIQLQSSTKSLTERKNKLMKVKSLFLDLMWFHFNCFEHNNFSWEFPSNYCFLSTIYSCTYSQAMVILHPKLMVSIHSLFAQCSFTFCWLNILSFAFFHDSRNCKKFHENDV